MAEPSADPGDLRLDHPQAIHIVYVGGKAMSALAEILVHMGHQVSGSDPNDVPILAHLRELGVEVHVGADAAHLGEVDLVACSTAVPVDHPERLAAEARGIAVVGRPRLQGAIARTRPTIAVSGTHGKSSTTAMLVHVLEATGHDPSYIVGGDMVGGRGGARWVAGGWFVVEADESDGTFLQLGAARAVVTNIEADHLDRYGSLEAIEAAFHRYLDLADEARVVCADDSIAARVGAAHGALTYGTGADADLRVVDVVVEKTSTRFSLQVAGEQVATVTLPEPGLHNALNATAAIAAAHGVGVPYADAAAALSSYRGLGRRFQLRGEVGGVTVVDDFAHNPGKVRAMVSTAAAGGWGRVVVAFQPHRVSRTAAQWHEFVDSFDGADVLVVTQLDPAGEPPQPGVDGRLISDAVAAAHPDLDVAWVPERHQLVAHLASILRPGDLCLTLGAGDITTLADALLPALEARR
ncbi:MAG: UDP-N-acetylmuramate--L-alanine ligase [Acidimicrobiia bacterium]|nr:UDP-N-acetylmuramate--L-alanine ligase [Acidimicrobiia bacterium]